MAPFPDDTPGPPGENPIAELVDRIALVDHHCHGIVRDPLDRPAFEALLCEATAPGPWHGSLFDTQVGFAVRRLCAPALGLESHVAPDDYLERRAELGADEAARRLLRAAGIAEYLVDTGFRPESLTTPHELAAYTGGAAHEVVRLESLAERVIVEHGPPDFADRFREQVRSAAGSAVAFKTIAAYRVGLDLPPEHPSDAAVFTAAVRWAADIDGGAPARLVDGTLARFLIWTAVDAGLPIQFHVGYGDADTDLARADPLLLMPLLRATADRGVPIMLLHNYPFHRHAGYLAQVFDHVFVDVGLAVQNVGARGATRILAELLELAPFGSVLFSTDGCGLPELFHVSAVLFRRALGNVLEDAVAQEHWKAEDAERIARMIARDNARRAYRLGSRPIG
ncbi:amidohydrolase family protein [Rhodococcus sp. W8901]|uniref:amidohydrolase family protein n=1 Tax=Rhodococcus sp. W8901 TaxID=2742603 RepID=UPI00158427D3|nr:amidohydrolase family protein [Rhodococcus sp. W8901]QKT13627.1 amidohydrolase family protein [Rhodococcus sp. W8901]